VLISEFGIDALDRLSGQEDEVSQAIFAGALASEIELTPDSLGGVYVRFADEWWRGDPESNRHSPGGPPDAASPDGWRDEAWLGIFRAVPTEQPGYDSLQPRAVYRTLAGLWGGRTPEEWDVAEEPRLDTFTNAASDDNTVSPGALARLTGAALAAGASSPAGEWPPHAGASCVCLGNNAAPVGRSSDGEWIVQVPWNAELGERPVALFRAGRASNFLAAKVQQYAPAIFPGGVVRAGTSCRASARNGVRPGEVLEVFATGLGAGPFDKENTRALINGTPAEILYAGLLPAFVGLNQVNLRVAATTPASAASSLELQREGIAGKPYPLPVADVSDRFGIALDAPSGEVLLQAGGPPRAVQVGVDGVNGYCGPVLFQAPGLPPGVSLQAQVAFTGQPATLDLRAAKDAAPAQSGSFVLIGHAPGASAGSATVRFSILPSRGDITVRVVSGGYRSSQPLARFDWNGRTLFAATGGGPGRGINVMAVDPASGVFSAVRSFDTWGDETAAAALVLYLSGLADGTIVLFAVADEGSYQLTAEAREAIAAMFVSAFIRGLEYQQSWALIGRKGAPAPIAEGASLDSQVVLERVLKISGP